MGLDVVFKHGFKMSKGFIETGIDGIFKTGFKNVLDGITWIIALNQSKRVKSGIQASHHHSVYPASQSD